MLMLWTRWKPKPNAWLHLNMFSFCNRKNEIPKFS
jgi:hypothetical protein